LKPYWAQPSTAPIRPVGPTSQILHHPRAERCPDLLAIRRRETPRRPSEPRHRISLNELCPDRKPSGQRPPGVRCRALSVSTAARTPLSGLSTCDQDWCHTVLREPQGVPADYFDQADGRHDPFVHALTVAPSSSCHRRHLIVNSCLRPRSDPAAASSRAEPMP
jgi:hypothetical protein